MKIKLTKISSIILCLMMIATVFLISVPANVSAGVSVTTDKYIYDIGEDVEITLDGEHWTSSVSYLSGMSYVIKDSNGDYVWEQPIIDYGYVLWACGRWKGPVTYHWNQTYRVYENHSGESIVPPSGEQVPPGTYYAYASLNRRICSGPAWFEIVDGGEETAYNLTVITNKYSYQIGEPVEIDVIGSAIWSGFGSEGYDIDYQITDEYGNIVRMRFYCYIIGTACGIFPQPTTPHPVFIWNQTYWIHDKNNPMAPSGEQVPTGKYFVWLHLSAGIYNPYGPAEFEIVEPPPIGASIDIDPDTLNLKSRGRWITAYITLPNGYDVNDIDLNTIMLEDTIPAARGDVQDDVLMVKFDRSEVAEIVSPGQVTLTIIGELIDETPFSGSDTIRVINPS
ncbi:MAG: hypothetical protein JSV56_03525 [Methanomassiliicoccales archaeon]|nr:MAG: hypothetical protein JSV56_03525 [Methanomassiliicoccales archaeon]